MTRCYKATIYSMHIAKIFYFKYTYIISTNSTVCWSVVCLLSIPECTDYCFLARTLYCYVYTGQFTASLLGSGRTSRLGPCALSCQCHTNLEYNPAPKRLIFNTNGSFSISSRFPYSLPYYNSRSVSHMSHLQHCAATLSLLFFLQIFFKMFLYLLH